MASSKAYRTKPLWVFYSVCVLLISGWKRGTTLYKHLGKTLNIYANHVKNILEKYAYTLLRKITQKQGKYLKYAYRGNYTS